MRDLHRNRRPLYYAKPVRTDPVFDEYGNDTLEINPVFSPPALLMANVSASIGQEAVEIFGTQTEYNRTVTITGECPLGEGDIVWFGVPIDITSGNLPVNNYVVVKVADSKNGYIVALREVSAR